MLARLTTRPALTATTAIVAVGLVVLTPMLMDGPPKLGFAPATELKQETLVDGRAAGAGEIAANGAALSEPNKPNQIGGLVADALAEPEPVIEEFAAEAVQAGRVQSPSPAPLAATAPISIPRERSVASDFAIPSVSNTEEFANEETNPVKIVTEQPVSTFSIDVDTASYSVLRSSIMRGQLPPRDAVRIEEMVNYFPYDYAAPEPGEGPFKPTVTIMPTPWNQDTRLMHVAIQGEMPAVEDRPPLNLVFLIDTSGSMSDANKLPLLKRSFRLMLSQLSPQDEVSIVTYAGSAGLVLDATPANDRNAIFAALDRLESGGSTAGQAGLEQAYTQAEAMASEGEVARVILATDGDFNVGINNPDALKEYIADKRDSGTYLSVLGFGRGNLDDATMQALAQNGNGTAAYIDTFVEAQKVLVDQLTGALFPIANDVKIQVEFNPAAIAEYRLIGYETRALKREDFNNDKVDAGEIGAGHSVTAIYELTAVGSPAVLNDPLRYSSATEVATENDDELGFLRLRYKEPGTDNSNLIEIPITDGMGRDTVETRFATAIAGFGQLLRDAPYTGDWSLNDAITLAQANQGADPYGYRREAVTLMRLAESLEQ